MDAAFFVLKNVETSRETRYKALVGASDAVIDQIGTLSNEMMGGRAGLLPWRFARPHRCHRFVPLSNRCE